MRKFFLSGLEDIGWMLLWIVFYSIACFVIVIFVMGVNKTLRTFNLPQINKVYLLYNKAEFNSNKVEVNSSRK